MVILKRQQESGLSVKDFCFNLSENKPALKTVPSVNIIGEIKIKLPGGIQVSFIGSTQTEAAIKLVAQICSAHVLPK